MNQRAEVLNRLKEIKEKKILTFSLDLEIKEFIEDVHWNYKMNRSVFLNNILKYLNKNRDMLDKIFIKQIIPEQVKPEKLDIFNL